MRIRPCIAIRPGLFDVDRACAPGESYPSGGPELLQETDNFLSRSYPWNPWAGSSRADNSAEKDEISKNIIRGGGNNILMFKESCIPREHPGPRTRTAGNPPRGPTQGGQGGNYA